MKPTLILKFALLITLLVTQGCATGSRHSEPSSDEKTSAGASMITPQMPLPATQASAKEQKDYQEAYIAFRKQNYDHAIQKVSQFEKKFQKSPLLPYMLNLKGLAYLFTRKYDSAIYLFKKTIRVGSRLQGFVQYIRYNLAASYYGAGNWSEAENQLNLIRLDLLDRTNQVKVQYLKAKVFEQTQRYSETVRALLIAGRSLPENQAYEKDSTTRSLLMDAVKKIDSTIELNRLAEEYADSPFMDAVLYRLTELYRQSGSMDLADTRIKELQRRFPLSPLIPEVSQWSQQSSVFSTAQVNPRSVGVLLPMKGKVGIYGNRALQAIELGFDIFNSKGVGSSPVNLIIEDSGEDPDEAVRALDRLVRVHQVGVVIGPLLGKGIEQVSQRAQELGVPMISLSRYDVQTENEAVIQSTLTLRMQAYEMARYAIESLKLKHFAVLHPRDKAGAQMSQYFWDAIQKLGGTLVGIESYDPGETDFRIPIDKLSGTYYREARRKELDEQSEQREQLNIKKRNRKTEKYFTLPPIVDFDAVFIADGPRISGQIIPTFAYRDIDQVKFLGTSLWNSSEFIRRINNTDGARTYFTDVIAPNALSEDFLKFQEQYHLTFNQEASVLEAFAYDAAKIVSSVVTPMPESISRQDILNSLRSVRQFSGALGSITYRDGGYERHLSLLSIKQNQIISVHPAR